MIKKKFLFTIVVTKLLIVFVTVLIILQSTEIDYWQQPDMLMKIQMTEVTLPMWKIIITLDVICSIKVMTTVLILEYFSN